jgi:hypothetical protein
MMDMWHAQFIVFLVQEISLNDIEGEFIFGVSEERAKIRIPRIVLERSDQDPVRMVSLLFRNMSGLLPERLEGNKNDRLVL